MAKNHPVVIERKCKTEIEYPETYLSHYVHNILVDLPRKISSENYVTTLTEELFFNWDEITGILNIPDDLIIFEENLEWFESKLVHVWGVANAARERFLEATSEKRENLLSNLPRITDPSVDKSSAALLEITLVITAALERFLGNVYYSYCARPVPFLLRDLLATKEMVEIFGKGPVVFSQLLFGCVTGLNVRNIAWHGFFSENELHINLVCCLLILFASLTDVVASKELNKHRETVDLNERSKPLFDIFPDLMLNEHAILKFINTSSAINPSHRIYWGRVLSNFKKERYGECLVMILPQLEHALRTSLCPSHLLCAQPSEFYVTLDQIISPSTNESTSIISRLLGQNLLEMLQDTFVFMDGPRIRDKISHGEVRLQDISRSLSNHVFSMALCTISIISQEKGVVDENLIQNYHSRLHPTSCLVRAVDTKLTFLSDWPELELVENIAISEVAAFKSTVYNLFGFQHSFKLKDAIQQLRDSLTKEYFLILHRQNLDIVAVSAARRLVRPVQMIAERVSEAYNSGRDRNYLHQRQQKTFERMISTLPNLQSALFSVLATLVFTLTKPAVFCSDQHKRLLKYGLKYVENVLSLCQKEKNRWLDISQLTSKVAMDYSHYLKLLIKSDPSLKNENV